MSGRRNISRSKPSQSRDFRNHSRDWRGFAYVYPVISRRSRGLSIGVNLNPDKACNFDCIYCQVDRSVPPTVRRVDLDKLSKELDSLLADAVSGGFFDQPEFAGTPRDLRRLNDIAFSGDGEPTTCPQFAECVGLTAELKRKHGADDARIILITDACYLSRPEVLAGLDIMDRNNGEIWAKLDAGTEAYYQLVNRPNFPLEHVVENILTAARVRPVVIQSMFANVKGQPPPEEEIRAFCDRLNFMKDRGAQFKLVQIYTVARDTAELYVRALTDAEVDAIASTVRTATGLPTESYYGRS